MNNFFKLERLTRLIQKDLFLSRGSLLMALILMWSLLLMGILISPNNVIDANSAPLLLNLTVFIGGIWISSRAFQEAHHSLSAYQFLTLPASHFEKFMSKLLETALFFPLLILVAYALFYWVMALLYSLVNHTMPMLFNPLNANILTSYWYYLIFQSIFLLGSIFFKNRTIIKTLLSIVLVSLGIALITALMGLFFAKSLFIGNLFIIPNINTMITSPLLPNIIHLIILVFLPLVCWLATYLRLEEIEV